jgi:hypothetical protein
MVSTQGQETRNRREWDTMDKIRAAQVHGAYTLRQVLAYMPTNYIATSTVDGKIFVIGIDDAGWTLDGYIAPRLASGNMRVTKVEGAEALDKIRAWREADGPSR